MQQIDSQKGMTIVMPRKARPKAIRSRRENGAMVGEIEYDDGDANGLPKRVIGRRDPVSGEMIGMLEGDETPSVQ
jgi:hypothetical protein